ncbi:hypothetical protein GCM10023264_12590 [Sphingomonas daechungensis]|uniref:hypothetical protein n=1 Tax=Sphingomonas daechungensis TaxID=1176646 RepID=UPI0031E93064
METREHYLQRRAREEDEAAGRASCAKARELHEELAARYRVAADAPGESRSPETVSSTFPEDFRILE